MTKRKSANLDAPIWFDGTNINEALFCDEFLSSRKIIFANGAFFTPDGRVTDDLPLRGEIYEKLKCCAVNNIPRKITNILEVMKLAAHVEDFAPEADRIHLANGTLKLDGSFTEGRPNIVRSRLPVAYRPDAPAPVRWLSFLDELLYTEDIPTLQEFIGYCLIPSNKGQRMMVIKGNGGEGKSQIGAVLVALLGSNMKDGSIGKISENRFARADLEHILLCVDDDMRMEALRQTNYVKSIVTAQGKIDLERKGKQSYQGWMFARLLAFSNGDLQALYDRSDGFYRRQLVLTTKEKPAGRVDDPDLAEKMKAEVEGIFLWAFEGFYAWMKLLENRTKPDDIKRSKIFENYRIIYKALCDSDVEPQLVYDGIKKLRLVDICLVPEDNAQLVFETVNSTGLPLSTADKIRNFLLMTVDPSKQTKLYLEYWHPMEKALGMESGESSQFESFFNYYMTSVLQRQLVGDYYDVFKNYYYENKAAGTEGIVKQIHQYSKYYTEWNTASDKGTRIQRALFKVRKTGQFKITPAILKLLSDRNDGLIADDDVVEILTIMESYWMRRAICALPTNTAGPVCISMLKSLNATNQLKSFKANLFSLTWAQRMPSDTEIKDTLKTLKIYSLSSSRTKTILDKLENNRRKEYVPTSEYTIEHIMPQTLSDDWKSDLGADANRIHETYVHTIGNLTLTGYNSEYQNKRFSDKVDCTDKAGNAIGYRHTPIKISSYLTTVSKWGEDEILARAEMLSDELITIWKYPKKD